MLFLLVRLMSLNRKTNQVRCETITFLWYIFRYNMILKTIFLYVCQQGTSVVIKTDHEVFLHVFAHILLSDIQLDLYNT